MTARRWYLPLLIVGGVLAGASSSYAGQELLGANPEDIVSELGAPNAVYSADSPDANVQAVVFFYEDYRYVYFYDNRVWQVRLDERSERSIYRSRSGTHGSEEGDPEHNGAVTPGDSRSRLVEVFGSPVLDDDESLVFEMEDQGFPVRLRAFIDDDERVVDMYLYRADY